MSHEEPTIDEWKELFEVSRMLKELAQDFEEYLPTLMDLKSWRKAPQLRTIPVNKSVSMEKEVMPYERAEELIRAKERFAVSNCICRQEQHILGKGCDISRWRAA